MRAFDAGEQQVAFEHELHVLHHTSLTPELQAKCKALVQDVVSPLAFFKRSDKKDNIIIFDKQSWILKATSKVSR